MRLIAQHSSVQPLNITKARKERLEGYISTELEDDISSRKNLDMLWKDLMRQYDGVPKNPVRNIPVENAPNIEVTLGAIAADSIYAQLIDLIFTVTPLVTIRATNSDFAEHSKALQRFTDYVAVNESNVRQAADHTALDDVQLGTGVYYIPFVENIKKTKSSTITERRPHVYSHPIEDLIVPGGSYDRIQELPRVALRFYLNKSAITQRSKMRGWDVSEFKPCGNQDWVRSARELLGRTKESSVARKSELYEVFDIYLQYDIDDDGIDEDLFVVYDRTSMKVGFVSYAPNDYIPVEVCRYQLRSHLFYGIGTLEMIRPYQEETTEIHNARTLNMHLANARVWAGRDGVVSETMKIYPSKVIPLPDPKNDLMPLAMADVYPSAPQAQAITTALAERRVGVNEMSLPRPSQVLGSRTPGITALSLLQQVNRRFTPAFDGFKSATANAIKQCLYRYQERLLAGDTDVEQHIAAVLGIGKDEGEDARLVVEVLKSDRFDDGIAVELTAASVSTNKEADRQNAMMLVNLLATYYQRTLELITIAANPQTPEPVREVAKKIADSAGQIIERTIRTFDQIRDPETFVIDMEAELDSIQGLASSGLAGLAGIMNGLPAPAQPELTNATPEGSA